MSSFFQYALRRAAYNSLSSAFRHPAHPKQSNQIPQEIQQKLNESAALLEKDAAQLRKDKELLDKGADLLIKGKSQLDKSLEHELTLEHFLYYALTGKVKKGVTLSQEEIDLMEKTFKEIKEEVKDEPFVKNKISSNIQ